MRHLWRFLTLLGGLVLTLIAFSMIAATTLPGNGDAPPGETRESDESFRLFQDSALAVRFRYPASWHTESHTETVVSQPDSSAQGALFVVARGAAPALPEALASALRESDTRRAADNVGVGGVSGRETVVEVDAASESASRARVAGALAGDEPMTVIVWESMLQGEPVQVIMADARGGDYLTLLQEMRASLEWE